MKKRNRKILLTILCVILLAMFGYAVNADMVSNEPLYTTVTNEPLYTTVTVEYNDTLWTIAGRHISDDTDIRSYVFELEEVNNITNPAALVPGQTIRVPIINK